MGRKGIPDFSQAENILRDALARTGIAAATGSRDLSDTRGRLMRLLDGSFFWIGTLSAIWLVVLLVTQSVTRGFSQIWFIVPIYGLLAYLVLPRVHTALSRIYLPDYFIGRARTREGMLGDPLNLGFLGSEMQLHAAMTRSGWTAADPIDSKSTRRIISSTLRRTSYPEAPVSNLYVFGRVHDFAYQREVDGNPSQRHHVRFWKTPDGWLLPGGHRVDWVAGATYDRTVGFSLFTLQITHKIEQDTDIERDYIVQTLEHVQGDQVIRGITVDVIENFSTGYHSRNGGGDSIITDGALPIVDLRGIASETFHDTDAPPTTLIRAVRPIGTAVGAILLLLRSGAWLSVGFILLADLIGGLFPHLVTDNDTGRVMFDGRDVTETFAMWAVIALAVFFLAVTIIPIWLTVSVFKGHTWSRLVAMAISTLTIAITIVRFSGDASLTLQSGLVAFSLDIGVLLALSGEDAQRYARDRGAERRRALTPKP